MSKTYQIIRDIVFFLFLVAILTIGICCLCCCYGPSEYLVMPREGGCDKMHQFDKPMFDEPFLPEEGEFMDEDFFPGYNDELKEYPYHEPREFLPQEVEE